MQRLALLTAIRRVTRDILVDRELMGQILRGTKLLSIIHDVLKSSVAEDEDEEIYFCKLEALMIVEYLTWSTE